MYIKSYTDFPIFFMGEIFRVPIWRLVYGIIIIHVNLERSLVKFNIWDPS